MFKEKATPCETTSCLTGLALPYMESIFDRLLRAAKELKPATIGNRSDLAKYLNESPQSITNWQSRGVPKAKILDVSKKLGISPIWLESGTGAMLLDGETVDLGPAIKTPLRPVVLVDSVDDIKHEVIEIPRYTVRASAGYGAPVLEIDTKGSPNYCRAGWAQRNGYKPDQLFSLVVAGDSMEPTIPDGASLIVHRQESIVNGKAHVICRGDQCYVKRLFVQLDGSILVRSDNTDVYKDFVATADDPDVMHVVGLVVSVSFNM